MIGSSEDVESSTRAKSKFTVCVDCGAMFKALAGSPRCKPCRFEFMDMASKRRKRLATKKEATPS